jgi:hypothetical protein
LGLQVFKLNIPRPGTILWLHRWSSRCQRLYSSLCSNASWSNQSRLLALSESMTIEITFNGLGMSLGNLSLLSAAQTRSIRAENFKGSKGRGGMATEGTGAVPTRELGQGWKVSPSIDIPGTARRLWRRFDGPARFNTCKDVSAFALSASFGY